MFSFFIKVMVGRHRSSEGRICEPGSNGVTNSRNQSPITSHQSPLTNHLSPITSHQSPLTNHLSPITSHQSPLTNHLSPITSHQSPLTNHLSPITSHLSPITSHLPPLSLPYPSHPCACRTETIAPRIEFQVCCFSITSFVNIQPSQQICWKALVNFP